MGAGGTVIYTVLWGQVALLSTQCPGSWWHCYLHCALEAGGTVIYTMPRELGIVIYTVPWELVALLSTVCPRSWLR